MDSGIVSYIRAFGVRWFVTMSGPLSVPLAVIAYFVQNDAAMSILFIPAGQKPDSWGIPKLPWI
jgi:hypothetical protein